MATYLAYVWFQLGVNCLDVLLQTFAVGKHFLTNVTLLGLCPGRNWLNARLVKVNHCMVLQLTHLVEPFMTDVTHKLLEIHMGLMVCLQNLGVHGPVISAQTAKEHVAISAMPTPQVGCHLPPLIRTQLTAHLRAAEAASFLLVAVQVIGQMLLLLEYEGTILE